MHTYRLYVSPQLLKEVPVRITGPDAHHISNVLRLKEGDRIILFDGVGCEYSGRIISLKRGELSVGEIEKTREANIAETRLNLLSALVPKFDFVVEKATELGVSEISPVVTERTQSKLKSGSMAKKLERWRKVAIAASMQSARIVVPVIHEPTPLSVALNPSKPDSLRLLASLENDVPSICSVLSRTRDLPKNVDLFVGPPADFTDGELDAARKAGVVAVRITENTLRTETAAVSALAIIASFFYSRSSDK
jgi:16S rRNA (uracil1498-N3)-methyltransferase